MYKVSEPSCVWKVERRPRASKRLSLLALSGPTEQEIFLSSYICTYRCTYEYCVKRQLQHAYNRRVVQGWAWSLLSSQRRDIQIHCSYFLYFESELIKLWWEDRKLPRQGLLTFASSPAVKGLNLPVQSTDELVCFPCHSCYILLVVLSHLQPSLQMLQG